MVEGTSMNKPPRVYDCRRFEGEIQISTLRSRTLHRKGPDLCLQGDLQHQIAHLSCRKVARPPRLKLETESPHAVCLTVFRPVHQPPAPRSHLTAQAAPVSQ